MFLLVTLRITNKKEKGKEGREGKGKEGRERERKKEKEKRERNPNRCKDKIKSPLEPIQSEIYIKENQITDC